MGKIITTDQSASAEESKPNASADCGPNLKPEPPKTRNPDASAKPGKSLKKTTSTPKSKRSSPKSRNLPPSAYMRPVITSTNANGEGGGVEWIQAVPKREAIIDPAQVRTMAQRVEDRMIIIIAGRQGGTPEVRTAYAAHLQQMRQQLGAGSDPLETLLIERIVLTWFRLQFVEEQAIYCFVSAECSAKVAEAWDKRLNDAHSRFLKSCLALERVRKLWRRPSMSGAAISALLGQTAADGLRRARGLPG
jgi:hypothetical protein